MFGDESLGILQSNDKVLLAGCISFRPITHANRVSIQFANQHCY